MAAQEADSFSALSGDDTVLGAQGNDIVDLGSGNDSLNFNVDADGATVYGKGGNDSLGITVSFNTPPSLVVLEMTHSGSARVQVPT